MRYAIKIRDLTCDTWFICPPDDSWYLRIQPENTPNLSAGYLPYYFTEEGCDSISHELLRTHIDFIVESSYEDRFVDFERLVNGVF